MSESSISFELSECVTVLKFISDIPPGHKPCYNTMTTISSDSWFATVRRRWGGEKGEKGLIYVNSILDSCDHHYRMCLRSSKLGSDRSDRINLTNRINLTELRVALFDSVRGFDNLIDTYDDQENIKKGYTRAKSKVINLQQEIDHYLVGHGSFDKPETDSDNSDDIDGTYLGEWDSLDIEKKSMLVSMLDSEDSSNEHRYSFFTTNNMTLLREGKKIRSKK